MKKIFKGIAILIVIFIALSSFLLIILNPSRGSFNNAVFEYDSITKNQEIMKEIVDTNRKDYNNDNHPFIKRRTYILYSIYDVQVSNTKAYHILGILGLFRLMD